MWWASMHSVNKIHVQAKCEQWVEYKRYFFNLYVFWKIITGLRGVHKTPVQSALHSAHAQYPKINATYLTVFQVFDFYGCCGDEIKWIQFSVKSDVVW